MDIKKTTRLAPFWRDRYTHLWCFICPLCKASRRVAFRPNPGGLRHVSQITLLTAVYTLIGWSWQGWKGIVAFVPFWTLFEIIYRWHVRASLSCSQCGFDPYLFKVDLKLAHQEVEDHWRKKFAEKGIPYPEKQPGAEIGLTEASVRR